MKVVSTIIALFTLISCAAAAEERPGYVTLPIDQYNQLMELYRDPKRGPAPIGYAIGQSRIALSVIAKGDQLTAEVSSDLSIKVLEDEWTTIPILPTSSAVRSVTMNGTPVELLRGPQGLSWSTKTSGSYNMHLDYTVDVLKSENGYALPLPITVAAATTIRAVLPGTGLEASIIPSVGMTETPYGTQTVIEATIPASSGVQISWRGGEASGYAISRALYSGKFSDDAIFWRGEFEVELQTDQSVTLKLFPSTVTLTDLRVDDKPSSIVVSDNHFGTIIRGKGTHKIQAGFQTSVLRDSGPPRLDLNIPQIPVSRIELTLPGKKEIKVTPLANVTYQSKDDTTVATAFVPMTEQVGISWAEAVPEEIKAEVRSNASIYHLIYAEEGVLSVHAILNYEITRGETNVITLTLPANVQMNRITSPNGEIADWRTVPGKDGKVTLEIYLNRKIKENTDFDLYYDRSIVDEQARERIEIPLLRAESVNRQRGMVAFLSSKELTLKPIEEMQVTRVGENQLPPQIRQLVDKTIAHTFKYVENDPKLIAQATAPEKQQGKFDVQVNTLISVGDVTMTGGATVEFNVKSGKISELQLYLPKDVNFLSLTAPSLRTHKVSLEGDRQVIDVQFTQEMEGQFRVDLTYEKIMSDKGEDAAVPTVLVEGAEVQQGRIAVEALSAVEVQPADTDQLSSLDPGELPQQLVLKTTNPILLAYKYVHTDPPFKLALKITKHKEIDVQSATIDQAHYRTLYTADGIAVTTAEFFVRNSRKQFLRVQLPKESEIWSVFVDGKAEKPAVADEKQSEGPSLLIKVINSVQGFPVQIVYQTPVSKIRALGLIGGALPRPDMIVTNTRWDVYLPDDFKYGRPSSNMKVMQWGSHVSRDDIQAEIANSPQDSTLRKAVEPLLLSVPTAGIKFSFEKLYANQGSETPQFSLPYASAWGGALSWLLSVVGALMIWSGAALLIFRKKARFGVSIGLIALGTGLLVITIGIFGENYLPAVVCSVISIAAIGFTFWSKMGRNSANFAVSEI